jgi:hypothetical protein
VQFSHIQAVGVFTLIRALCFANKLNAAEMCAVSLGKSRQAHNLRIVVLTAWIMRLKHVKSKRRVSLCPAHIVVRIAKTREKIQRTRSMMQLS